MYMYISLFENTTWTTCPEMEQAKVLFDCIVFLPVDEICVIIPIDNELTMKTTDGLLQRFLLERKQIN